MISDNPRGSELLSSYTAMLSDSVCVLPSVCVYLCVTVYLFSYAQLRQLLYIFARVPLCCWCFTIDLTLHILVLSSNVTLSSSSVSFICSFSLSFFLVFNRCLLTCQVSKHLHLVYMYLFCPNLHAD